MIQNSFIDMESMFKLFEEEEEVPCETGQCLVSIFTSDTALFFWVVLFCLFFLSYSAFALACR